MIIPHRKERTVTQTRDRSQSPAATEKTADFLKLDKEKVQQPDYILDTMNRYAAFSDRVDASTDNASKRLAIAIYRLSLLLKDDGDLFREFSNDQFWQGRRDRPLESKANQILRNVYRRVLGKSTNATKRISKAVARLQPHFDANAPLESVKSKIKNGLLIAATKAENRVQEPSQDTVVLRVEVSRRHYNLIMSSERAFSAKIRRLKSGKIEIAGYRKRFPSDR